MEFDINAPLSDLRFDAWAQRIAMDIGLADRADANETAIFARQLEFIYSQTYDVKYPEFKARLFVPVDSSVPTGAESYTYRQFDEVSMAEMIANYGDDIVDVTTFGKEFTAQCYSMAIGYSYSIQDVRRAQMAGMPLESKLSAIARRGVEAKFDQLAAFGDSARNMKGFLNHPNVPLVTPATGTWTTATSDEIVADIDKLVNSIVIGSNGIHIPDTLLFSIQHFTLLNDKQRSVASDKTILTWFLENNAFIKNVDHWYLLATADNAGTGPRIVCYQRNPENLGFVVPQEFEQFPPQTKNLAFFIPCHARCGGTKVTYPLSLAYMDGC